MLEEIFKTASTYNTLQNATLTNVMVRVLESEWSSKVDPILTSQGFIGIAQTRVVGTDSNDQPVNMLDAEYAITNSKIQMLGLSPNAAIFSLFNGVQLTFLITFTMQGATRSISVPVVTGTLPVGSNPEQNPFVFQGFNPKQTPALTDTVLVRTLYPAYPISDLQGPYSNVVESFYTVSDIAARTAAMGYITLHSDGYYIYTPTGEQLVDSLGQTASPTLWRVSQQSVLQLFDDFVNVDHVIAVLTTLIRLNGKSSISGPIFQSIIDNLNAYDPVLALLDNPPVSDAALATAFANIPASE